MRAVLALNHVLTRNPLLFGTAVFGSGLFLSKQTILCQSQDFSKRNINLEDKSELEKYWNISLSFTKDVRQRIESTALVRFGRAASTVLSVIIDYKYFFWKNDPDSDSYKIEKSKCHLRSALKLRDLCCINGGLFIKVGQHIGALDYLLPEEYVKTMKVLHTDAPQSLFENVIDVVEKEFGASYKDLFVSFDEKPIGSASLAQVHKAELKDGRVLALKVQHKDVQEHSLIDMATIEFLVSVVRKLFPDFRFNWLVEEIQRNVPVELDFLNEGKNCELLGRMLSKFPYLKVPKIHWDLTTKRVLAMEYCEGGRIDDLGFIDKAGLSKSELSWKLGRLYSEMIFVNGYIHCDPHPGNILVRKNDEEGAEIILLDHGLYQTLTDDFRITYCKLWQALMRADVEAIKHYSEMLGVGDMYGLFACIISARSWETVTTGIDKVSYSKAEVKEIQQFALRYMPEITDVLNRVPRQMILLLKTNDLLRGLDSKFATPKSFVALMRCCVTAVKQHDLQQCENVICQMKIQMQANLDQLRISFYQFSSTTFGNRLLYIWTYLSSLFSSIFNV